ncbi:hypothetical protein B0H13DRAFT_2685673 [Mycena leptocephala]|nr:hypothetical protein B0H13DRAFT_2685673 [Mycena leptocephala]
MEMGVRARGWSLRAASKNAHGYRRKQTNPSPPPQRLPLVLLGLGTNTSSSTLVLRPSSASPSPGRAHPFYMHFTTTSIHEQEHEHHPRNGYRTSTSTPLRHSTLDTRHLTLDTRPSSFIHLSGARALHEHLHLHPPVPVPVPVPGHRTERHRKGDLARDIAAQAHIARVPLAQAQGRGMDWIIRIHTSPLLP